LVYDALDSESDNLAKIANWTGIIVEDLDGSNNVPTLNDYTQNNITGVHAENLNIVNAVVASAPHADSNTVPEIQVLVDVNVAAISKISDWAGDSSNTANAPTLSDYEAAGVVGLTTAHKNIELSNLAISLKSQRATDTASEIQAVIDVRISDEFTKLSASPQIVDLAFSNLSVITLQLKDVQGNNLTSGGLKVEMTDDSIQADTSSVTDNNNGTYSVTMTHNEYKDTVYIHVKVQGVSITPYIFVSFADFSPPQVYSASKANVPENTTAVLTVQANDVGFVKYSLSTLGNDPHLFDIDSKTGVLVFKKAPNYEKPTDKWGHNTYEFTVLATDDRNLVTAVDMVITVTDIYEPTVPFQSGQTFKGLLYYVVESPHTGRYWLDRNLGATRAAKNKNDDKSFGDYYQWGRNADGHQKPSSGYTEKYETSLHSRSQKWIISQTHKYELDWLHPDYVDTNGPKRLEAWNDGGTNDICPRGYGVPTEAELDAELGVYWKLYSPFEESFLKLPQAGFRLADLFFWPKKAFWYWTKSVGKSNSNKYSRGFTTYESPMNLHYEDYRRTWGMAVRCILEE
jgi:hypothetical protein